MEGKMSKDIKKALEHCVEWNCDNCPNREELVSGEIVCRGRLLPEVLEYVADLEAKIAESEENKNMLYKCLTEKDIEIETKKEEIAELQKQLEEKEKEIKAINNYRIKLNIKPYIFTAKYECWSVRQTEDNHKYLILVEEEGKLKPAGSYSTKSKRLLMYNVKYTPPLTILEKVVTSCELFERM